MELGPATAARTNERNEAERALRVAPLAVVEPRVGIDNARHSHGSPPALSCIRRPASTVADWLSLGEPPRGPAFGRARASRRPPASYTAWFALKVGPWSRCGLPYGLAPLCLSYTSVSFRARFPITSSGTAKTYSFVATLTGSVVRTSRTEPPESRSAQTASEIPGPAPSTSAGRGSGTSSKCCSATGSESVAATARKFRTGVVNGHDEQLAAQEAHYATRCSKLPLRDFEERSMRPSLCVLSVRACPRVPNPLYPSRIRRLLSVFQITQRLRRVRFGVVEQVLLLLKLEETRELTAAEKPPMLMSYPTSGELTALRSGSTLLG
jgi:hypothetical protein